MLNLMGITRSNFENLISELHADAVALLNDTDPRVEDASAWASFTELVAVDGAILDITVTVMHADNVFYARDFVTGETYATDRFDEFVSVVWEARYAA